MGAGLAGARVLRRSAGLHWERPAELAPGPRADAVSGRPEPAGLGVHEAPAVAVDVAGPRRAALWRLRPPRVHAADVHPAVLQQRRGRSRGRGGCWSAAGPCPPFRRGLRRALGLDLQLVGLGWPFPSCALLQEVAVEALLQATGLPADLVHHALTPLTHGEGVLVRSCTPGGERGAGAPRGGAGVGEASLSAGAWVVGFRVCVWGWGPGPGIACAAVAWGGPRLTPAEAAAGGPGSGSTAPRGAWGSFRAHFGARLTLGRVLAPGALRLNQAALARASGRHLRLLPRQRYLRAERADVSALERKRNVLCCLITRILKVEKQLHIDNLVFRVWRARGAERGCPGAAPHCSVGLPWCCR